MKPISISGLIILGLALLLTACGQDSGQAESGTTMAPETASTGGGAAAEVVPCPSDPGITYICGVMNAEDLLSLGDTGMILTSGMSSDGVNGHLYLVNPLIDTYEDLVSGPNFSEDQDTAAYPDCPGPLDVNNFSAHGLALNETSDNRFDLYITSHGDRDSIEMFDLDMSGGEAKLTWKGCEPLPADMIPNSVAILDDGGFVATKFSDPATGFDPIYAHEVNGYVAAWHPGGQVAVIAGTELSGANGITLSEDGRYMFVAAFGSQELVRFELGTSPVGKESVKLDISPDNVRWNQNGKLLTAGNNYVSPDVCGGPDCATGWSVVEVDPETLEAVKVGGMDQTAAMQGISSALQVNDDIWVGTFSGDRIGYIRRQ